MSILILTDIPPQSTQDVSTKTAVRQLLAESICCEPSAVGKGCVIAEVHAGGPRENSQVTQWVVLW